MHEDFNQTAQLHIMHLALTITSHMLQQSAWTLQSHNLPAQFSHFLQCRSASSSPSAAALPCHIVWWRLSKSSPLAEQSHSSWLCRPKTQPEAEGHWNKDISVDILQASRLNENKPWPLPETVFGQGQVSKTHELHSPLWAQVPLPGKGFWQIICNLIITDSSVPDSSVCDRASILKSDVPDSCVYDSIRFLRPGMSSRKAQI